MEETPSPLKTRCSLTPPSSPKLNPGNLKPWWLERWGGGRQEKSTQGCGKFHPGFWKIPPRLLENSIQAFGKSHPGFWKTTIFARTVRQYFLDKQVSEEKLKKWPRYVELNWTIFMYSAKTQQIDTGWTPFERPLIDDSFSYIKCSCVFNEILWGGT